MEPRLVETLPHGTLFKSGCGCVYRKGNRISRDSSFRVRLIEHCHSADHEFDDPGNHWEFFGGEVSVSVDFLANELRKFSTR